MLEVVGDIWEFVDKNVIVITTNGSLTKDHRAIMGRGVARQATSYYPWIQKKLGDLLFENGNHVFDLGSNLVTFPVEETAWSLPDLRIIERSAKELRDLSALSGWEKIIVPRPGCGGGGLLWSEVKPVLERFFDNKYIIISSGL